MKVEIKFFEKMKQDVPVFIVGIPRSGTTLLTQILNASGQIYFGTETHFFEFINRRKNKNGKEKELIKEYLDQQKNQFLKYFQLTDLEWSEIYRYSESADTIKEFITYFFKYEANRKGIERWGEKTPGHYAHISEILRYFPQAKIINIIRDPRAVFQSHQKVNWGEKSPLKFVKRYKLNIEVSNSSKNCSNLLTVKFEDLLSNPRDVVQNICAFCDLKFSNSMIESFYNESNVNYDNKLESWKFNYNEIKESKIDSWNNEEYRVSNQFISYLLKEKLVELNYPEMQKISMQLLCLLYIKYWILFTMDWLRCKLPFL